MAAQYKSIEFVYCGIFGLMLMVSCHSIRSSSVQKKYIVPAHHLEDCFPEQHVGYVLVNAKTGKTILSFQSNKYFTPASNTKLATTYASLLAIKDSIVRFSYRIHEDTLFIRPYGDPTWYHPSFDSTFSFFDLIQKKYPQLKQFRVIFPTQKIQPYSNGTSWEDFNSSFFKSKSLLCLRANQLDLEISNNKIFYPYYYYKKSLDSFNQHHNPLSSKIYLYRDFFSNSFFQRQDTLVVRDSMSIPFYSEEIDLVSMLSRLSGVSFQASYEPIQSWSNRGETIYKYTPLDTVLHKMLLESDNFLAEQLALQSSLLLTSAVEVDSLYRWLIISMWRDMPQKMFWSDGSGLSRYNKNTPQNLLFILEKLVEQYGAKRFAKLLPTPGIGTLVSWSDVLQLANRLYAKTGSLTGVYALCGILLSRRDTPLFFSVMLEGSRLNDLSCFKKKIISWYEKY